MEEKEIYEFICSINRDWKVSTAKYGLAIWIDITTLMGKKYTIQITPEDGVGLSERTSEELDFGGHEKVFSSLKDAISFILEDGI